MLAIVGSTSEVVIPGLIALALTVAVAALVIWQLLNIGRRGRPFIVTVLKAAAALSLFRIGGLLYLLYSGQSPYSIAGIIAIEVSYYPEGALVPTLLPRNFSGSAWPTAVYMGVLIVGSLSIIAAMAGLVAGISFLTKQRASWRDPE